VNRPNWDEYFLTLAKVIRTRSTCMRRQVGAVLTKDNRILTTGYNGPPRGLAHCKDREGGCLRDKMNVKSGQRDELCRAIHAEANTIIQAALHGVATDGSTLYCTTSPCNICAKLLIGAGVRRIVTIESYPADLALEMLQEAKVDMIQIPSVQMPEL